MWGSPTTPHLPHTTDHIPQAPRPHAGGPTYDSPHTKYQIPALPTYHTAEMVNNHLGNTQTSPLSQRQPHGLAAQTAECFCACLLTCARGSQRTFLHLFQPGRK